MTIQIVNRYPVRQWVVPSARCFGRNIFVTDQSYSVHPDDSSIAVESTDGQAYSIDFTDVDARVDGDLVNITMVVQTGLGFFSVIFNNSIFELINVGDTVWLKWSAEKNAWTALNSPLPRTATVSWAFDTLLGGIGQDFTGGYYLFSASDSNLGAPQNFGNVNNAYGAHAWVVLGDVPAAAVQVTVSGTSIGDGGVRVPGDSEILDVPSGSSVNSYFETSRKWLGQIQFERTAGEVVRFNFGYAKYWDLYDRRFRVVALEATATAFLSDPSIDIQLIHHSPEGWTFNAGAPASRPAAAVSMAADYGTDVAITATQFIAYKRNNIDVLVDGGDSQGILIGVSSSVANSIQAGNINVDMRAV